MRLTTKLAAAALAVGLTFGAASRQAEAAAITATGSIVVLGVSFAPTGSIGAGTQFTFAFSLFSSGTGDLSVVPPGSSVVTTSMTATNGTAVEFDSAWGSFVGTVIATDVEGSIQNRTVSINALGTFTPDVGPPDLTVFDPGPMSLTFSATQTGGPGSSVSASYTIASPPVPVSVPEPASLVLLGAGLLGIGAARRASRKVPENA